MLFFTRGADGDVAHVLLAVEERKVPLKDLGRGTGSGKLPLLVFPQGKVEPEDKSFVDTARREFVEETADAGALAACLAEAEAAMASEGGACTLPVAWFMMAKMAVIFCEVERVHAAEAGDDVLPSLEPAVVAQELPFPLRPVWVEAAVLRNALASSLPGVEVLTSLGSYPIFPMARRFLWTAPAQRWLDGPLPPLARRDASTVPRGARAGVRIGPGMTRPVRR